MFCFSGFVFGAVQVLKATELWGFVSIKQGEIVEMVVAPSRHVFDEDFYVQFMYISFCFKCVLGSV